VPTTRSVDKVRPSGGTTPEANGRSDRRSRGNRRKAKARKGPQPDPRANVRQAIPTFTGPSAEHGGFAVDLLL